MTPLPTWARRKILDGFVRRWAKSRVKGGGFPLENGELIKQAKRLLTQGKLQEFPHNELSSVADQLLIHEMDGLPMADDAWRRLLGRMTKWNVPLEPLTPSSIYVHFAAAEEHLRDEEYAKARSLAHTVPGQFPLAASDGKPSRWPQVLHIDALAAYASGDPHRSSRLLRRAIDGLLNLSAKPDTRYVEALEKLRSRVLPGDAPELTASDSAAPEDGDLILAISGPNGRHSGYWRLGGKRSQIDLNDLQVRTAKAFVPHLRKALRSRKDKLVKRAAVEKPIQDGLDHPRTGSTLRDARSTVRKSLKQAIGAEVISFESGSKGGILFLAAPLIKANVRSVRQKKL